MGDLHRRRIATSPSNAIRFDLPILKNLKTDLKHFADTHRQRFYTSGRQHWQIVHEHWQSRSDRSPASTTTHRHERQFVSFDSTAFGTDWMRQRYGATWCSTCGIRTTTQSAGHRRWDELGVGQYNWQLSRQLYLSQRWNGTAKYIYRMIATNKAFRFSRNRHFGLQRRNHN